MIRASIEAILIFVLEMVLSFVCTIMFTNEILPQNYTTCVILAIVCLAITCVLLVISIISKAKRGYNPSDIAAAYIAVFAFFAVVTLFLAIIKLEPFLTHLFLGYKVFAFGVLSRFSSAFIVNVILCAVCVITPILCDKEMNAERIRSYLKDDNGIDS